jgi:membrane protein YqaA with SNARE-associated domain
MNIFKRLYNWILHWADTRWGVPALFCLAFAESSFFPIPPDVLLIALCLGLVSKSFRYATVCTVGSVTGALCGYALGYFLWQTPSGEFTSIANFFFDTIPGFTVEQFDYIRSLYEQYDFWIIFTAGFTPIPYKLFTITSGVFDIDLIMFTIASIISRGLRFFLIGWLIWKFGAPIKSFIDKYFNLLAIAFTVLLIGGFLLIKYIL